jgi:hypothetical protein
MYSVRMRADLVLANFGLFISLWTLADDDSTNLGPRLGGRLGTQREELVTKADRQGTCSAGAQEQGDPVTEMPRCGPVGATFQCAHGSARFFSSVRIPLCFESGRAKEAGW